MSCCNTIQCNRAGGLVLAILAASSGGCHQASLASSTGPRPPGHQWSMANRQMVHVGEQVAFHFVIVDSFGRFVHPLGLADYCVTFFGNERIEATPDIEGFFQFSLPFDRIRPGQTTKVTTTAYRQLGGRDFVKIRGEWLRSDSPYEIGDRKVASDSIIFTAYEVLIELRIVRPPDDLDPETGVLRICRDDGACTSVYVDLPDRRGFTLTGPGPDGYYRVRYQPVGNELNPTGTTDVRFTIYDQSGQPHHASLTIETP